MKEEILEFLQEVKYAYQSRAKYTASGLCKYVSNKAPNYEIRFKLLDTIDRLVKNTALGIWFKDVCSLEWIDESDRTVMIVEEHYSARLELIDLLINHFNEEFQEEDLKQTS